MRFFVVLASVAAALAQTFSIDTPYVIWPSRVCGPMAVQDVL
jgi:hypothetical protein